MNIYPELIITTKDFLLGQGACSKVYHCQSIEGISYAAKVIDLNKINNLEYTNIKREIKIQKSLYHLNILKLQKIIKTKEKLYLIQEFASNGNLFPFIPKNGFPEKLALKIFSQILNGVIYLHEQKIIHRDIKPENILFDSDFQIKICDFGWSCKQNSQNKYELCGTFEYMAPEIINFIEHTKKVDIWALGILLYELLHGKAPYNADSIQDITRALIKEDIEFDQNISKFSKKLIKNMLKRNPKNRCSAKQIKKNIDSLFIKQDYLLNKNEQKYLIINFLKERYQHYKFVPLSVQQYLENNIDKKKEKNQFEKKSQNSLDNSFYSFSSEFSTYSEEHSISYINKDIQPNQQNSNLLKKNKLQIGQESFRPFSSQTSCLKNQKFCSMQTSKINSYKNKNSRKTLRFNYEKFNKNQNFNKKQIQQNKSKKFLRIQKSQYLNKTILRNQSISLLNNNINKKYIDFTMFRKSKMIKHFQQYSQQFKDLQNSQVNQFILIKLIISYFTIFQLH